MTAGEKPTLLAISQDTTITYSQQKHNLLFDITFTYPFAIPIFYMCFDRLFLVHPGTKLFVLIHGCSASHPSQTLKEKQLQVFCIHLLKSEMRWAFNIYHSAFLIIPRYSCQTASLLIFSFVLFHVFVYELLFFLLLRCDALTPPFCLSCMVYCFMSVAFTLFAFYAITYLHFYFFC